MKMPRMIERDLPLFQETNFISSIEAVVQNKFFSILETANRKAGKVNKTSRCQA